MSSQKLNGQTLYGDNIGISCIYKDEDYKDETGYQSNLPQLFFNHVP